MYKTCINFADRPQRKIMAFCPDQPEICALNVAFEYSYLRGQLSKKLFFYSDLREN